MKDSSVDELSEMLVQEIRSGIEGTGVRPGVIGEIGSHGTEMSASEKKCFRAAAMAALTTGLPVSTHAHLGIGAVGQLELLQEEGLPADRICLGHQDLTDDLAQHERLAKIGAFVAFDTVGKTSYQPDEVRVRLMLALLEAGYKENILLSNDISRESYFMRRGGVGYSHLFRTFLPRLREEGVDERTIRIIVEENPKRFLTRAEEQRHAG
ncbi:MAG: phosphotriesterase family protein [Rubrobacteraceae bacterium]